MHSGWQLALAALLLVTGVASAQETGEITGRVTDASGALLPGVVVTATGPVLLEPLVATTGPTGTYLFPRVPIGTYRVAFELAGFSRVVREDIKVEIGFGALVNARLDVAALEHTVTVTGEPPIVDTRDSTKGGLFAREDLDRVPTARDPWAVVARAPGVIMAGVNVGGNLSGMQGVFIARTPSTWMNRYTLDGVDITDLVFGAGSSIYYDFDSFQEVRVTTGGGEPSQMGGGVGVNMVTRSGTDMFRGTARIFLTDDSLESDNVTQSLRAQGAGAGNPIKRITDYGFETGGRCRGAAPGSGAHTAARTSRSAPPTSTRRPTRVRV